MGDHGAMACAAAAQAQGARKDWGLQFRVREEFSVFRLCCLTRWSGYLTAAVFFTHQAASTLGDPVQKHALE